MHTNFVDFVCFNEFFNLHMFVKAFSYNNYKKNIIVFLILYIISKSKFVLIIFFKNKINYSYHVYIFWSTPMKFFDHAKDCQKLNI